jgi:hypothetical protein
MTATLTRKRKAKGAGKKAGAAGSTAAPSAHKPTGETVADAGGPVERPPRLRWSGSFDGCWYADTTSGVWSGAGDFTAQYHIDRQPDGKRYVVTLDHPLAEQLGSSGVTEATLEDAQAWCEHQEAKLLEPQLAWRVDTDRPGVYRAENMAGVKVPDGGARAEWVIAENNGRLSVGWHVPLHPRAADVPAGPFDNLADAKAWAERQDRYVTSRQAAAPPRPRLRWQEGADPGETFAPNTAGIEAEGDLLAEFVVTRRGGPDAGVFVYDVLATDPVLMPKGGPPESFATLDAARAWCERRNAELVATAKPDTAAAPEAPAAAATSPTPVADPRPAPPPSPGGGVELEAIRRLNQIRHLGRLIEDKRQEIGRQETKVAEVKANLDRERKRANELNRQRDELINELETLALGKSTERLFPPVADAAPAAVPTPAADGKAPAAPAGSSAAPAGDAGPAKPAPADDTAWRDVPLDQVITDAKACKKLVDAGIKTFGDLEDWRAGGCTDPKVTGFGGVDTKGRKLVDEAAVNYWQRNPRPKPADAPPPAGQIAAPTPDKIDLAGCGWIAFKSEGGAETWYQHNVVVGPVRAGRLGQWSGPFPDRKAAAREAGKEIEQWLRSVSGDLRGQPVEDARRVMAVAIGLQPLRLAPKGEAAKAAGKAKAEPVGV